MGDFSLQHLDFVRTVTWVIVRLSQIASFVAAIFVARNERDGLFFLVLALAAFVLSILLEGFLITVSAAVDYFREKELKTKMQIKKKTKIN